MCGFDALEPPGRLVHVRVDLVQDVLRFTLWLFTTTGHGFTTRPLNRVLRERG
jgi:hypothetical protein